MYHSTSSVGHVHTLGTSHEFVVHGYVVSLTALPRFLLLNIYDSTGRPTASFASIIMLTITWEALTLVPSTIS